MGIETMSINTSGLESKLQSTSVSIFVSKDHKLIKLANVLPLEEISDLVVADLRKTTESGFWWLGRPIVVRIHLMIYLLQKIFNYTDRQVVELVKENAVYQLFCGLGIVDKWHVPVHQKVEEFRNRLTPQTQQYLANLSCKAAVNLGLADASILDIDSTTQEANMSYPSDANLMVKLARKVTKVAGWIEKHTRNFGIDGNPIDISELLRKARGYFFQAKNAAIDKKREAFEQLFNQAKKVTYAGLDMIGQLKDVQKSRMPWNIAQAVQQVESLGKRYILDVAHYVREHTMKAGKIMAFHLDQVACLTKGKAGKAREFGREFQIGRIGGNFVFSILTDRIRADDKTEIPAMLDEHQRLFGVQVGSFAADKGYQSKANERAIQKQTNDYHLGYAYEDQDEQDYHRLYNRRAGIEPVIGHIKAGGQLGKSRMKSDTATLAAGYGAMAGFNLRQIMRKI